MNSEVQEMINLVREEMERMISRNPEQEKSMETDIQIVRELIPEAYVCLDKVKKQPPDLTAGEFNRSE